MDKKEFIIIGILLALLLVGAFAYPHLPDQIASHWNASGEVDGYMSKFWGVFLIPLVIIGTYLLFLVIPKIAPHRERIKKFKHYFTIKLAIVVFLAIVYIYSILFNLGYEFSINALMPVLLGGLFFIIGFAIKDIKKNYFIGIRTPWTLANDTVWKKTHQFGSKTFMIAGLISAISAIIPKHSLWISITAILIAALIPIVYSYIIYKKTKW